MAGNPLQRSHVRPALRSILILGLMACGGLLLVSLIWIFHKIHYSLGVDIAEVAMALICILILGLIAASIRAGLSVDRFIRYRKEAACRLYESSSLARYLLSVLGYAEFP